MTTKTTIDVNGRIWTDATEHQTKDTSKGLLDCVVATCSDLDQIAVLVRVTPAGAVTKEFFKPVQSVAEGEQMIAGQLAKAY